MAASSIDRVWPVRWVAAWMMHMTPHLRVPEHLPPAGRVGVDRTPARRLVGREQVVPLAEAADGAGSAEAPRPDTQPAEVLHRVTEVRQLPVEDRPKAFGADDEVPVAEVAVDDGPARRGRAALLQPAEGQLEGRVRLAERVEQVAELA